MVLLQVIFLDSDDFEVNSETFECDSVEIAEALRERYIKAMSKELVNNDYRQQWLENNVSTDEDNVTWIEGFDCGHGEIRIFEPTKVTAETVNSVKLPVYNIY